MAGLVDLIAAPILKIIDKVIPDPTAKAAAQLEVLKLQQSGELAQLTANVQLATGQMEVNKVEAGNASTFVSGWRPFIGWVCGTALAYQFILAPLGGSIAGAVGHPFAFIKLDLTDLLPLLAGMLGLSGMRTVERLNGAQRDALGK